MSQKYDYCFLKSLDDYVVFDLETTGFCRENDEIIEIAAIRYSHGQKIQEFHSLIRPSKPIPQDIVELTGITQADVDTAPSFYQVLPSFQAFIEGLPLVGHNICSFDVPFINAKLFCPLQNLVIDTLVIARDVFPALPNHSLVYLNHVFNLGSAGAHRAFNDVETTNALFMACLEPFRFHSEISAAESGEFDMYIPCRKRKKSFSSKNKINSKEIVPTCEHINPDGPLFGKTIVFTGTLSIPRGDAMQMAVNAGAKFRFNVSRKTSFLVVGEQDMDIVGLDGMSNKEEEAYALNASGKANIQIINEAQFLALVQEQEEGAIL